MADICHECENPAWTGKTIEAPALPSGGEGGTSNFDALVNRPKYDGTRMTGNTDIPNTARDVERLDEDITDIQELIPETTSPENQLADKEFVNSSVATNTANFVGTYSSLEELQAVENPSNNDYGFVISTDEQGNTVFNRYKYVSSVESWEFEYALNNSSFTAAQWAAINSGITEGNVEKLNAILGITSIGNGLILENNGQLRQKLYTETGDNTDAAMDQKTTSEAIDAVYGHARLLTSADYNYPEEEPSQVNLFLLPAGVYRFENGTSVYFGSTSISSLSGTLLVKTASNNGSQILEGVYPEGDDAAFPMWVCSGATSSAVSAYMLSTWNIEDTLNGGNSKKVLSAAAGKTLKDLVDSKQDELTAGDYISIDSSNRISALPTGLQRIEEDTNLWDLAPGLYTVAPNIKLYYRDNGYASTGNKYERILQVMVDGSTDNYGSYLIWCKGSGGNTYMYCGVFGEHSLSPGPAQIFTSFWGAPLTRGDIANNLTTTAVNNVLDASQGKVLNDKIDAAIINGGTTAPTTSTEGSVGTLYSYVDTSGTNPVSHIMVCTAIDTSVTPNTYTWTDLLGDVESALNLINNGGN